MEPTCLYGSEPVEGAPDYFEYSKEFLLATLEFPFSSWATEPGVLAGLPIGPQRVPDFCAIEVLTNAASNDDWALVASGFIIPAMLTGAFDRVMGDIKRHVWAALCVCKAAPLPDPPIDHDGVWCGRVGPLAAHTSGTWTLTGIPEGIVATEWILYPEVHDIPGDAIVGQPNWATVGLAPVINSSFGFATPTVIGGMQFDGPQPSGGVVSGTYTAGDDPIQFSLCVSGGPADAPPYDPGIPEFPEFDPPETAECTLEELCDKVFRLYAQGFSTLIEVLRNQGLMGVLTTKVDNLQESADSILVNLAANTTIVVDVQEKVNALGDRVELARRDASYLRRVKGYDGFDHYDELAGASGEGDYATPDAMIGLEVYLETIPASQGHTGVALPAYYQLGYVQFNSSRPYTRKFPIVAGEHVFVNVPVLCQTVHFFLSEGVTATFVGRKILPDAEEETP